MAIIHREGHRMLIILGLALAVLNIVTYLAWPGFLWLATAASLIFFALVLQFFRNPKRTIPKADDTLIYAPADGQVVVIEEAEETEYFNSKRLQVSIFMSPLNVHVNRNPLGGEVRYLKHHPGKYLVAWHPKSSTENERTTVVIKNGQTEVLLRQIAGAMAKRIRNYLSIGDRITQGSEMGFIKFGSRVDLFLPLDAEVKVNIGDKVKGNKTVIAKV
ncbi:MAG: phosphatidylserine decarboxylase family protein [Phaeodactylibacter xiamenensis]|uniref:Phosphatidylserine decarboxylase proenzyme n=1 Tax=Phaeodactylibacter xiamenensis TaxID=1524460 RepID=A0A098S668_9BACT|nr:phosphatidylserine decarboxylase family protein [Phaeodactylibacter xiamenensis]KGE87293.1 phosphatidylserine decarboxylase [Phaeodactylibacter xiamenensis]MCR9052204.1 phosphatidylserine decarboxylase family protein [bacterium]